MTALYREPLPMRAARYFGFHDRPRAAVRLNNDECLIVARMRSGRMIVAHYSETRYQRSGWIKLTDRSRDELIAALGGKRP